MKHNAVIVLVSVFVLVIAAITALLLRANSSLGAAKAQAETVAAELSTAQAAIGQRDAAATEAASELASAIDELKKSEAKAKALSDELDATKRNLAAKQAELNSLSSIASCPGPKVTIDYTSNATVSEGLKAWAGDMSGNVTSATWM
jgi:uncharacterized protein (DUF3084 family)